MKQYDLLEDVGYSLILAMRALYNSLVLVVSTLSSVFIDVVMPILYFSLVSVLLLNVISDLLSKETPDVVTIVWYTVLLYMVLKSLSIFTHREEVNRNGRR